MHILGRDIHWFIISSYNSFQKWCITHLPMFTHLLAHLNNKLRSSLFIRIFEVVGSMAFVTYTILAEMLPHAKLIHILLHKVEGGRNSFCNFLDERRLLS